MVHLTTAENPSQQAQSRNPLPDVQHNSYFENQKFWILATMVTQLLIFVFACSWLGVTISRQCISLDSHWTGAIVAQPRILVTVVTLLATGLSLASAALFGSSVKEAMRHWLWEARPLVEVSAGVALSRGSHIFEWNFKRLTIITWIVFGALKLLVTGWTTLLEPTLVSCYFNLEGTELNLISPAFSDLLAVELGAYTATVVRDGALPVIDVGESVSGITDAGVSFGIPGIINFNDARYNISTGGLLPSIQSFAGSKTIPGPNETRMQFSGGMTVVDTKISHGSSGSIRDWLGIQRNFSVDQQGLTADIHCQPADASSVLNLTNLNTTVPIYSPGSTSPAYTLIAWNSTANCSTSSITTQQYVTWANASGQPDVAGTGFLPAIVCPGQVDASDVYSKFVIAMQGFYKYDFLPSTICEVTPLVTTTRVDYKAGGIINPSRIISNQTFSSDNNDLLFFLAGAANYHGRNSQGLYNNIIGDTLYSTYSGRFNTSISSNTDEEDYWRGVIEFSATFLRAGYSAEGAFQGGIPSNMTSPLNGTMFLLTMGWAERDSIYLFSILPLGIITVLTVIAGVYSLFKAWQERRDPGKQASFDISKTRHLMAAIYAGSSSEISGSREADLLQDDSVRVQLRTPELGGDSNMLVVVKG
ncbi:hypothetical protein BU15DRAFT_61995 [Melanogaster broomeanus]|nr:hypothetical protein BU15DRAFT_61995 [Melanogaster broomeanus]